MAYIITRDLITDGTDPEGTNLNAVTLAQGTLSADTSVFFRLLDDDDELYYEGLVTDDEDILDVLDWATINAGATQMLISSNRIVWKQV